MLRNIIPKHFYHYLSITLSICVLPVGTNTLPVLIFFALTPINTTIVTRKATYTPKRIDAFTDNLRCFFSFCLAATCALTLASLFSIFVFAFI